MKTLIAIACALALFACQKGHSGSVLMSPATLEFRGEASPGEVGAQEFEHAGTTILLSKARRFEVELSEGADVMGKLAVLFTVFEDQDKEFGDFTEALIHRRLAIFVGGEIVSLPSVTGRMKRVGLIEGGRGGFSREAFDEIIATIEAGAK